MMLNPVLRREARTSLRSWKIFAVISLYVAIVALASGIYIWNSLYYSYSNGFNPETVVELYIVLSTFQLLLILITTPAITAGSISGEREKQTLDLLIITKMSPLSIVMGKLLSCLGLIMLMIVSTLPVFGIVFYFGGISLISLLGMTVFLIVVSCMIGSISIFLSSIFKKTVVAMVVTYLIIGFLCTGTVIAYLLYRGSYWVINNIAPSYLSGILFLCTNPVMGFIDVLDCQIGSSHFADITRFYYGSGVPRSVNFWIINGFVNLIIIILFVLLASKVINPIIKGRK